MARISEALGITAGLAFFAGMFVYGITDTAYGIRVAMDFMIIAAVTGTTSYVFSLKAKEM